MPKSHKRQQGSLPCLMASCQMPVLKRNLQGETQEPRRTRLTSSSVPPGGTTQTEPDGLQSMDVAMAHAIPLLVTQTRPDNLTTTRPVKYIFVLENYLKRHPISQLKSANRAKQIKLPLFGGGWAPWTHGHLQDKTMAVLLLSLSFPTGFPEQARVPQQWWGKGDGTRHVLTPPHPSPAVKLAKIHSLAVPGRLVPTS